MRVLAMAHAYPPDHNAGAEMTLHSMLRHLAGRGHDVHVHLSHQVDGPTRDYTLDGVSVHAYTGPGDVMPYFLGLAPDRADVVIAHLQNTLRAASLAGIHRVPMVHLLHNTHQFTKGALMRGPTQLAVFNSEWMRADFQAYWSQYTRTPLPPSIVIHPPVIPADYRTARHGKRITLINLNEEKGGHVFWRLARALPDVEFLGVKGAYGPQIVDELPNVEVVEHLPPHRMAEEVFARTKVLLMPSSYESYGRTGIEAAYNGIPTIAHPTHGLKEALGEAGTFVDRDDLAGWVSAIKYLRSPRGFSAASARARAHAEALDPQGDLDRFADAMEGVLRRGFAALAR